MNSFLLKARMEVEDLFKDLADGRKLLKLLEIISGEKLGKPNSGKMRVHHVENVNKSLAFLHTKVRLESIGAEDIVDGNPRLILGLIWTIILRFQIQEIEIDVDEDNHESTEKKSAKDALLLWCQRKTSGYPNVAINDFTGSWRSGLGFNALIHAHRPDLINYSSLVPSKHIDNLNNAFDTAERGLGIPRLLDAEDIDTTRPDEKSILTYVASYYHTFARMKSELKGGRRIANIINQIMEAENLQHSYELQTTDLLNWIILTTKKFNDLPTPPTVQLIKTELSTFKNYRTTEKPPKYVEKSEIEANYHNINIRLKELNQNSYSPPDGKYLKDIEKHWELLEKSENKLEAKLKSELLRQMKLEEIAVKFWKKAQLRSGYLKDMIQVLSDVRYGINLGQIEATLKKHEAISADILAREERCMQLREMSEFLSRECYHDAGEVKKKADLVLETWNELIQLLNKHRVNFDKFNFVNSKKLDVANVMEEILNFRGKIQGKKPRNLIEAEELLSGLGLEEVAIGNLGEYIEKLKRVDLGGELKGEVEGMVREFGELQGEVRGYRVRLEEELSYFKACQDLDEELEWVEDKRRIVRGVGSKLKDLRGVVRVRGKLKTLQEETKARSELHQKLLETCSELSIETTHLTEKIHSLKKEILEKHQKLSNLEKTFQTFQDCNEIGDWINEKKPLVESLDFGNDVATATALLQRHKGLINEIESFRGDVVALENRKKMGNGEISGGEEEEEEEVVYTQEQRLVPQDYYEEEVEERTEYKTVTEERPVAQVKALYPFNGQDGLEVGKGEVMFLLSKTNTDWWNVRKSSGVDGFVPANYVKEIEPKVVMVQVRKPELIKETKRIKKTKMVMETFNVKKKATEKPIGQKENKKNLEARISQVVNGYREVVQLGETRLASLHSSIHLHHYLSECDDFEKWLLEKHRQLTMETTESIETEKKKFDKLFTDLSACTKRLENIDAMATTLKTYPQVQPRQKQIHKLYEELNKLKNEKEKSLEGASIVELFHRNCSELNEWIDEKREQIEGGVIIVNDLKTVQGLQRKHLNIERELVPVREKVERVRDLGTSALREYPREEKSITAALAKSQSKWQNLLTSANTRRSNLDAAVGMEIFQNSYKSLKQFSITMETEFLPPDTKKIKDVSTAEDLLKSHEQLLDELKNKSDEFHQVIELGVKLDDPKIVSMVTELKNYKEELPKKWQQKQDLLSQILDLKMFEKEADSIDRQIKSPKLNHHGNSLEEIEYLIKQHDNYENSLLAMDERVRIFVAMAEKLEKIHNHGDFINQRKNEVLEKRNNLKTEAMETRKLLQKSLNFHEFETEIQDMLQWIGEKKSVANSEDFKDLANLEKKLKKHAVFSGELRANEVKLNSLNKIGEKLVKSKNNEEKVEKLLKNLNQEWNSLKDLCTEKYKNLKQAEISVDYLKNVDQCDEKISELEKELNSKDLGKDRRACKELLKKHEFNESELNNLGKKIDELVELGELLVKEGHFDGERILQVAKELKVKLDKLKDPARKRREALEELLRFYDFLWDLDNEMGYIKDKEGVVVGMGLPGGIHEAGVKVKKVQKHHQELVNHAPVIEKVLATGGTLIEQNHPEKKKIEKNCEELRSAWSKLLNLTSEKQTRLEFCLKTHQYYNDAAEVEAWIQEKVNLLTTPLPPSIDKSSTVSLLTKHKTTELEIDSYTSIIQEMGHLISKSNPDYHAMVAKQQEIEKEILTLKNLANEKRSKLIETMNKHEFFIESAEFRAWIEEMIAFFSSEDYGVDHEHLERIKNKFFIVKNGVKQGEGKLKNLDALVARIPDSAGGEGVLGEEVGGVGSILQVHGLLCDRWNYLLTAMEARELKLIAAGEIHRFNRDVADALERIHEKINEIPEETGKDYNSCELLLRNMENFENDLVPLEAQLQVLLDDSTRLSTLYPTNAPNIHEEQQLVLQNWQKLQSLTDHKKSTLQTNLDFYKFKSHHRDLTSWFNTLLRQLDSQDKSRDATLLMTEHEQLKLEIDSRKEKYSQVLELGNSIKSMETVAEKLTELTKQLPSLESKWASKKIYLDQLIDLQIFLRDSKTLSSVLTSQEIQLLSDTSATTVEELEKLLKKHLNLEHLISTQEPKFQMLEGKKLIEQNHFDKVQVSEIIQEITEKRSKILTLCSVKKSKLEEKLTYLKFLRDVEESLIYLQEKEKILENLNKESLSLEEKVKKLKKHQAFEAELLRGNVPNVIIQAEILDPELHKNLHSKYENLLEKSRIVGRGLEEAHDILEFQNKIDKLEEWIRIRENLILSNDLGRDFEHCEDLIKRLDLDKLDDSRIEEINSIGKKLGQDDVIKRLHTRWTELKSNLSKYKSRLEDSLEIHHFNFKIDELDLRISDKIPSLKVEDLGKDLESVEGLLRKLDQIEVEMGIIQGKIREMRGLEKELIKKDPSISMEKVVNSFEILRDLSASRRTNLQDSLEYQKYLRKTSELEKFTEISISKLRNSKLPVNLKESKELLETQTTIKNELHAKLTQFDQLHAEISKIIENNQYFNELNNCLELITDLKNKLIGAIETRDLKLNQGVKLQNFYTVTKETEELQNELDSVCKYFLGDELGLFLKMLKFHEDSVDLLKKCELKTMETCNYGEELLTEGHYSSEEIKQKIKELNSKFNQLKINYDEKTRFLIDGRDFKKFLNSVSIVNLYLNEKNTIATDDNYSDMTNLQSKIQKHETFQKEIGVYLETKVVQLNSEGQNLISEENLHGDEILEKLKEVESLSEKLIKNSNEKRNKLYESYSALLFFNNLEDLDVFLEEGNFEDEPSDLQHAGNLLKKWSLLKESYHGKFEIVEGIKMTNRGFKSAGHFMHREIDRKVTELIEKFDSFSDRIDSKIVELQISYDKFLYSRDLKEITDFITEKNQSIENLELGNSVEQVGKLGKILESINQEIESMETKIKELNDAELTGKYEKLRLNHDLKKKLLGESLKSQVFQAKIGEANFYIKEKSTVFNSADFGSDEESCDKLIKKFHGNYQNLQSFKSSYEEILNFAGELEDNYDCQNIKAILDQFKTHFSNLQKLADTRKQKLLDAEKLYRFKRESTELTDWIELQIQTASSEDYGRDVEHVEILIQKFDTYLKSILNNGENRVGGFSSGGKQLIELKHPDEDFISEKVDEIGRTWEEFKELAGARTEALEGAKRVHVFDRMADETVGWMGEKLVGGFSGGEVEEKILREAVEKVVKEGRELGREFPDAEEHVESKLTETLDHWTAYLTALHTHQQKLIAMETISEYFTLYETLTHTLVEFHTRVATSALLTHGVEQSEQNLQKLVEITSEYNSKLGKFTNFVAKGTEFIRNSHFLSEEINVKITTLQEKQRNLVVTMETKKKLLEQNLDLQKFLFDLNNFDANLKSKMAEIEETEESESLSKIESNLREFEDLEMYLELIGGKLEVVERVTLIEEVAMERKLREIEEEKRRVLEGVRQREIERIKGERQEVRRGSDPSKTKNLSVDELLPRSSSFRTTPTGTNPSVTMVTTEKKPKRTPSFTTRRRTTSFRKLKQVDSSHLPPITIDGYLERKHEFLSPGKRATNRSWKTFYTVLCGQLLCFFKDQEDFVESKSGSGSPVNIFGCQVEVAGDYLKKRHVFRVRLFDGSEYLFACESEEMVNLWVEKLTLVGKLEPREQLSQPLTPQETHTHRHHDNSNDGDQSSSEDEVRMLRNKPRSREPLYANVSSGLFVEEQIHRAKPPIPPRSSSIVGAAAKNGDHHGDDAYRPRGRHGNLITNNPYHSVYQAGTLPGPHGNAGDLQPRSSGSLPTPVKHDSSSESDTPKSHHHHGDKKAQKKAGTGLMGLFKRKKATQL